VIGFAAAACRACPARPRCTPACSRNGRQLSLHGRDLPEALQQARTGQDTSQRKHRYNIRAGAEGTIRQVTHVTGIRRARCTGLPRTRLEHNAAAAINLIRLDARRTGRPLGRTRTTHLQRLNLTAAA
jgi:hypothetical protein